MKNKLKSWVQRAPDRKAYIEVITALLTVPVLVTVLLTNFNNLTKKEEAAKDTQPTPKQEIVIKEIPVGGKANEVSAAEKTPTIASCKKEIGPISISYPRENQTVDENPLNVIIKYDNEEYCSVVWSYRINGGAWSEYSSNSISLYNMPAGEKKLELRVQSTVSQDQDMVVRTFIYNGQSDPTATSSAQ